MIGKILNWLLEKLTGDCCGDADLQDADILVVEEESCGSALTSDIIQRILDTSGLDVGLTRISNSDPGIDVKTFLKSTQWIVNGSHPILKARFTDSMGYVESIDSGGPGPLTLDIYPYAPLFLKREESVFIGASSCYSLDCDLEFAVYVDSQYRFSVKCVNVTIEDNIIELLIAGNDSENDGWTPFGINIAEILRIYIHYPSIVII